MMSFMVENRSQTHLKSVNHHLQTCPLNVYKLSWLWCH